MTDNATDTKNINKNRSHSTNQITTILFDVDDTLYDVSCGFTEHRNGEVVHQYMVEHLMVPSLAEAKGLRDEYFDIYHATAKALTVAQHEGKFPIHAPPFDTQHLANYWVTHLDYTKLGPPKTEFKQQLQQLPSSVRLIAFSNGPREYVKKVLQALDLFDVFGEQYLYAVDDVLPYCKPEPEAFQTIFQKIGNPSPDTCIMVEDSMKNIRVAHQLGMKTILITGTSEHGRMSPDDRPEVNDPAVDCFMETIEDMKSVLPGLWETPPVFHPPTTRRTSIP